MMIQQDRVKKSRFAANDNGLGNVGYHIGLGLLPKVMSMILYLMGCVSATPLPEKHSKQLHAYGLNYFRKFGYLSGASQETGNLMSMEDMSDQIKRLQRLGRIPQTGVIDSRTQELMEKPRCGNSDNGIQFGNRKKRYTLASSKWKKKNLSFRCRC